MIDRLSKDDLSKIEKAVQTARINQTSTTNAPEVRLPAAQVENLLAEIRHYRDILDNDKAVERAKEVVKILSAWPDKENDR